MFKYWNYPEMDLHRKEPAETSDPFPPWYYENQKKVAAKMALMTTPPKQKQQQHPLV